MTECGLTCGFNLHLTKEARREKPDTDFNKGLIMYLVGTIGQDQGSDRAYPTKLLDVNTYSTLSAGVEISISNVFKLLNKIICMNIIAGELFWQCHPALI